MIVLHLQCKNDGTVRMSLQKQEGTKYDLIVSRLLTDENAKRVYEAVFAKCNVEKISPRIWVRGLNWVNPQDV